MVVFNVTTYVYNPAKQKQTQLFNFTIQFSFDSINYRNNQTLLRYQNAMVFFYGGHPPAPPAPQTHEHGRQLHEHTVSFFSF